MELYSAWYCPFAQRIQIALAELGVEYDLIEINPYNKTRAWLETSLGTGQVPVLVEGSLHVPDSLRVLDYLEDRFGGGRSIFGHDIEDRAHARFWIDQAGKFIIPNFYRFLKAPIGSDDAAYARDEMEEHLARFARTLMGSGPFFSGEEIGAVDIAVFPFAYRISLLLNFYRGYQTPTDGEIWARYFQWFNELAQHPSFLASKLGMDNYDAALIDFYKTYAQGGGQQDVTEVAS